MTNIVFESTSQKNVTFPFALTYKSAEDPQGKVILDLANKCGVTGGQKSNINVNYKLTVCIETVKLTIQYAQIHVLAGDPYHHDHHLPSNQQFVQFPVSSTALGYQRMPSLLVSILRY